MACNLCTKIKNTFSSCSNKCPVSATSPLIANFNWQTCRTDLFIGTPTTDGLVLTSKEGKVVWENTSVVKAQSDWDVIDPLSSAYIKNKPTIPSKTSDLTNDNGYVIDPSYHHTENNFTSQLLLKLNGIETGAKANVQSDWTQTTATADDFIKNKPNLDNYLLKANSSGSITQGFNYQTGVSASQFTSDNGAYASFSTAYGNIGFGTQIYSSTSVTSGTSGSRLLLNSSGVWLNKNETLATDDGHLLLTKSEVQTLINQIQLPQHYKGQVNYAANSSPSGVIPVAGDKWFNISTNTLFEYNGASWTSTVITPTTGDYYNVIRLIDHSQVPGNITYNGTSWDIAANQLLQPDNATIGLSASGALKVKDASIGTTQLDGTTTSLLSSISTKESTANKDSSIPTAPTSGHYPETSAVKNYVDGRYTNDEKTKLAGIQTGAQVNVQSDWNQNTDTASDYIKNKPTIPSYRSERMNRVNIEGNNAQINLGHGKNFLLRMDQATGDVTINVQKDGSTDISNMLPFTVFIPQTGSVRNITFAMRSGKSDSVTWMTSQPTYASNKTYSISLIPENNDSHGSGDNIIWYTYFNGNN